ncbi:MAG: hypothetical protein AAF570_07415, partial [Bacteroidota bacterium]
MHNIIRKNTRQQSRCRYLPVALCFLFFGMAIPEKASAQVDIEIFGAFALCGDGEVEVGLRSSDVIRRDRRCRREVDRPRRRNRRVNHRNYRNHGVVLVDCGAFGEHYREREDDEFVEGFAFFGGTFHCAEMCFDETVAAYSYQYGYPDEIENHRDCGEIERSAIWDLG